MKRTVVLSTLMVFTSLMLFSACSHERVVEREMVKEPPAVVTVQPPVVTVQPQRPATWVPGYWVQGGDTMVWRPGHWE